MLRALVLSAVCTFCVATLAQSPKIEKGHPLTRVTFQMLFNASANIAPYAYGIEKGYFKQEGIDLIMQEGPGGKDAALIVAGDKARFGGSDAGVAADLISEGKPLKIVGTLQITNPSAVTFIAGGSIRSVKDLKGKKVGFSPGTATFALFPALLDVHGLSLADVTIVNLKRGEFYEALKTGRVSAIGLSTNSLKSAEAAVGKPLTSLRYSSNGLPLPGNVLIVNTKYLANKADRELNCRMVRATMKSWAMAAQDTRGAAEALVKQYPKADGGNVDMVADGVARVFDLTKGRASTGKPFGYTYPEDWQRIIPILKKAKIIEDSKPFDVYFTNEYIDCDPATIS